MLRGSVVLSVVLSVVYLLLLGHSGVGLAGGYTGSFGGGVLLVRGDMRFQVMSLGFLGEDVGRSDVLHEMDV